jgi:hypothetical protein
MDVASPHVGRAAVDSIMLAQTKKNLSPSTLISPWPSSSSLHQHAGVNTPANPGKDLELNAIVAALSTGPVGISDQAGLTNKVCAI